MTQREVETHKEWPELTTIEYYILVVLITVPRHGIGIFEAVARRTNQHIILLPGTLYAALKRMYAAGWIKVTDPPGATQRTDERRKFYQLTDAGRQVLDQFTTWMETEARMTRTELDSITQRQADMNTQQVLESPSNTPTTKEETMERNKGEQLKSPNPPAMRLKHS